MSVVFGLLFAALVQDPTPAPPTPRIVTVAPNTTTATVAPGALPDAVREGDRLICRTESVVGTNRRQRVCMTAAQRQAQREQSRDLLDGMNRLPADPLPTASGG